MGTVPRLAELPNKILDIDGGADESDGDEEGTDDDGIVEAAAALVAGGEAATEVTPLYMVGADG